MVKIRELTPSERVAIYNRREGNEKLVDIAKDYSISPEGVRKIHKRLKERGNAENVKRSGRKRLTTARQDRQILIEVKKDPNIRAKELKENLNLNISITSIKSRIHESGLKGRVSRKKPYISPQNMKKRLAFAKQYVDQPMDFWKTIIWSDESKFEFVSNKRRKYVWRKDGEAFKHKFLKPSIKHGRGSIMVSGCFSFHGVGRLAFVNGILNGQKYVDLLINNLFMSINDLKMENNYVFQQDNDPKHTSRKAKEFFESQRIPVLPWLSQSPDINPIEHLWDEIDRLIPKNRRNNKQCFQEAIMDVWENIPKEKLEKLVMSIPNRLKEVIYAKGGNTRY